MKRLLGGPGTVSGFLLRLGQCAFGASSIGLMITAFGFSSYTAFWYSPSLPFLSFFFCFFKWKLKIKFWCMFHSWVLIVIPKLRFFFPVKVSYDYEWGCWVIVYMGLCKNVFTLGCVWIEEFGGGTFFFISILISDLWKKEGCFIISQCYF